MDTCVFCSIVAKKIPSHTIYEDEKFLAFLDINPKAPGHTQIIPKKHHRWVWDVPEFAEYTGLARRIALSMRNAYHVEMVWSKIMGDEVPHAHIWVYAPEAAGDPRNFATEAERLRSALHA